MRQVIFCSLPVEMEALMGEEENGQGGGMKDRRGKRGGEMFVSVSLEEMESYYRYSSCCERLHREFLCEI